MIDFLSRHRTGLTFAVIVMFLFSTIASQVPAPDHPSLLAWGVYAVVSPVQQVISYMIVGARNVWESYVDLRSARAENAALSKEVSELLIENQKLRETLALVGGEIELKAIRELYRETYAYDPIEAMIIGAGTGENERTAILNKGSIDGVTVDQGVISSTGVVGKVVRVGPTSCLVQLVTDPAFAMAARLQSSRVRGIVRGTGKEHCELLYVRDTDAVSVDDRVVSSGLERVFPRGILIGRVSAVGPTNTSLRHIEIIPSADLRSLEWVLIVQWHEEISDPVY
jgi:rod shape-determining protein MreC